MMTYSSACGISPNGLFRVVTESQGTSDFNTTRDSKKACRQLRPSATHFALCAYSDSYSPSQVHGGDRVKTSEFYSREGTT